MAPFRFAFLGIQQIQDLTQTYRTKATLLLPMMIAGPPGGETSVCKERLCSQQRGLKGFVLYRYKNVEGCASSLGPRAQDHAWDLAEYTRVEQVN